MDTEQMEINDLLDVVNTRTAWLSGIARLITSQTELSEMNSCSYLMKEDWGNIGWLLTHHIDEIEALIDKCFK